MNNEEQFWNWFKNNEYRYFFINQIDNKQEIDALLDELLERLQIYCENLFFEIGGNQNEKQDLIITAEGNTDFFDHVESLVKQAPLLEYWNVIAFKPFADSDPIINYNGIELDSKTIWFFPLGNKASNKIGLSVYITNYDSSQADDYLTAVYLLLDNILGEKSSALDIGYVEIKSLPLDAEKEDLIELIELPRYIKWKKSKAEI